MTILLLAGELLFVSIALFTIFRLRDRLGLGPLFLLIGANAMMAELLAASVFFRVTPSTTVSPGSTVLFPLALVAVLLVYLCEDIPKTRTLIFSVVLIDIGGTILLWMTSYQLRVLDVHNVIGIPTSVFHVNTRTFLVGTIVLLVDFFLLVILFQFLERKASWLPQSARVVSSLTLVLLLDAALFSVGSYYGDPVLATILSGQLKGKLIAGILYGVLLSIYLRYFERASTGEERYTESLDVLSILTYQERYEIVRRKLHEEREASLAKSRFLAHMSHELRTPLNAIIGFSQLLLTPKAVSAKDKRVLYLERVYDNAHHLLMLINDMLDLSKIEAGRLEIEQSSVDLTEMVAGIAGQMRSQARAKDLDLTWHLPPGSLTLESDPTRLRQVLLNLIDNAIKFTHQGGVTVRLLAREDRPEVPLCIEVTDTGIGIPRDLQERIFEAFSQAESGTTRSFDGTGLGLTISRALCEELGFRLEIDSTEGRGSTFRVVLS